MSDIITKSQRAAAHSKLRSAIAKRILTSIHGINNLTGLPKRFRGIVLGPSGSGKSNLAIDFIKRSPKKTIIVSIS